MYLILATCSTSENSRSLQHSGNRSVFINPATFAFSIFCINRLVPTTHVTCPLHYHGVLQMRSSEVVLNERQGRQHDQVFLLCLHNLHLFRALRHPLGADTLTLGIGLPLLLVVRLHCGRALNNYILSQDISNGIFQRTVPSRRLDGAFLVELP